MKQPKRILAGAMAVLIVLSTVLSYDIVAFASTSAKTIAAWEQTSLDDYMAVPYSATSGNGTLELVGAKPVTFSGNGFNSNHWNLDEAYWIMKLSTVSYENIAFSAEMRASNTGPKDMQLQYSIDEGTTWTDVNSSIELTTAKTLVFDEVKLPSEVSNRNDVLLRIKKSSNISVNNGTVQENGTCSIKNIKITSVEGQSGTIDGVTGPTTGGNDAVTGPTQDPEDEVEDGEVTPVPTPDQGTEDDSTNEDTSEEIEFDVETGIELEISKWAGTGNIEETTKVFADLEEDNDQLDKTSSISLSTGKVPMITSTSGTGGTTYSLGAKGLVAGTSYVFETTSDKYANITLSYSMKASGTAAKSYDISYSTNGTKFTKAETVTLSESGKFETVSVTLPKEASNKGKLYIRVTAGDVDFSGKAPGTGSNNYIQNISIKANPITAETITGLVNVTPDAGDVVLNQELTMSSKTQGATIYYSINDGEKKVYDEASKPVLDKLPAVVSTYAVKEGKEDSLKVTYGYTQSQVATIKASPNGGAVTKNTPITLTSATEGAQIVYSLDQGKTWVNYNEEEKVKLSSFPGSLYAKATKEGYLDSAQISLSFTERKNEEYGLFYGQLHSHTNLSDGAGEITEAYEYAKGANQIDFLAVTDHSNSFDGIDSASILGADASTKWEKGNQAALEATTEDFVGIYGYEMTWSNGLGHMNTFNTNGFQSRTQTAFSSYATALNNYYNALNTDLNSISQFNHPGTSFGDFSDFAHYSEANDALINLVEVGNGEGAIGSTGYFPSFEYYTRALDKGWHVAPTISQDNHKGRWGDANTGRTVVLADELNENNIYDALRNKRVYATEDDDLEIRYTLDGNVMGTELDKDAVGNTVTLEVDIKDPTDKEIGTVQVIVNGGLVIDSKYVASKEGKVTFELPADYSYYYIKVVQADGAIAVTAPVWVGEVEAVGISSLTTETSLPVQGEAVDVTLEMYNNEASDLLIESIKYSIDNKVVHTADLQEAGMTKVETMGTNKYTFDLVYNHPGSVNVEVEIKATLNGVEKIYKGLLKLEYVVPAMVTNIVVDGTHFNDYVNGYYGGNMTNFAKLASNNYAKVTIVTDEITDEILADCNLLVVSAPAKKNGNSNSGAYTVSHFEDEFLQRVKKYTDNGGSIIVCGMADYQDSVNGQSSTEVNKLLQAIGSTVEIYSDQMQDNDNNGGQAYRLYLTDLNKDSFLMEGTVEGQKYSAYSGCSVNLTNAMKDTKTAKAAEWLVKGHETTYSLNTKAEDGSYLSSSDYTEVVKRGDVIAAARQELASGANVIVAGTVFISNFEVEAELDNIWDVPYANRTMIENLVATIKAELPVSTIADARKGQLGDVYRVQGRVTAGTAVEANKFFDAIYIQDQTGGMTIFPYSTDGLKVGSLVEIIGYVDEYQGDRELQIMESKILDDKNLVEVAPEKMSAKDAMDYDKNGGQLIQVEGTVTDIVKNGSTIEQFRVTDSKGDKATVFIDGYITAGSGKDYDLSSFVKEGNQVSAVGILYKHPEGDSDVSVPCLRVRNTEEIVLVKQPVVQKPVVETPAVKVGNIENLKVKSATTSSIELSWKAVSGATGYRVGTYVNGKWSYTTVKKNSFTHSKLSACKKVTYSVQAFKEVNGKTYYGKRSSNLKAAVRPETTKLTATANGKISVSVSYSSIKGVSGYEIAQYKNGKWVVIQTAGSKTTAKTIRGLKEGTTYKFRIRGYVMVDGKKLYGKYSSALTTATKTKTPAISSIKTSGKKVTVSWKRVSGATGYEVYKYNTSKKKYEKVKTITKASTVSYTKSGLKKGTTVKYRIRTYKTVGSKKIYSNYSAVKSIKVK
ncbi:MAG: CehA/McbA family metallohydrolase [bacterium]|nr:CehA/McbA family metallohydrolase [bacterium]